MTKTVKRTPYHCHEQYSQVAGEFAFEGPPKGGLPYPMRYGIIPVGRCKVFREGNTAFALERGNLLNRSRIALPIN
jgi:hypothetical protein